MLDRIRRSSRSSIPPGTAPSNRGSSQEMKSPARSVALREPTTERWFTTWSVISALGDRQVTPHRRRGTEKAHVRAHEDILSKAHEVDGLLPGRIIRETQMHPSMLGVSGVNA